MKDDTLKQDDLLRGELVRLVVEEPEVLAQTYVRWFRDSEWSRLMDSGPAYPHSVYALKKWIEEDQPEESGRDYVFQIRTLADDRLVGDIGLEGFKHGRPDAYVGIAIAAGMTGVRATARMPCACSCAMRSRNYR
ncbi:MAG: GNAT family N-acetyltransferase [Chloroflexota bacterium]